MVGERMGNYGVFLGRYRYFFFASSLSTHGSVVKTIRANPFFGIAPTKSDLPRICLVISRLLAFPSPLNNAPTSDPCIPPSLITHLDAKSISGNNDIFGANLGLVAHQKNIPPDQSNVNPERAVNV